MCINSFSDLKSLLCSRPSNRFVVDSCSIRRVSFNMCHFSFRHVRYVPTSSSLVCHIWVSWQSYMRLLLQRSHQSDNLPVTEEREVVACYILCNWRCDPLLSEQQRLEMDEPRQPLLPASIKRKLSGKEPQLDVFRSDVLPVTKQL